MPDNMTGNRTSEAAIEDDVRRTQDRIGDTVDKIEEKLDPREITRSVIGDENTDVAEEALDIARTNPIPVAMIAIGAIWLVATSPSPAIRRIREAITGKGRSTGNMKLRPRSAEPAPIGPPPPRGEAFDRRADEAATS